MEDGMKALALVDSPDHVCCRYRIRAFQPALDRAGWSIEYASVSVGLAARMARLAGSGAFDAAVLQRKLLPVWQLQVLRRASRRLIFDFDDAVLFRDSYDSRGPLSPRRYRRFQATVRAADAVVAGNDFLADCALRAGAQADRVHVIPTCVEPGRYVPSCHEQSSSRLDLVWIGSGSTLQGLERQRPLWETLAGAVSGLRMRVVCDRFPDLGAMPVVKVHWSETSEAAALATGDVGVSWVPDDDWSRGKCGLKILQYQAAGLPVVTNPVGVHTEMVVHGVTGWLATTPEDWIDAVRAIRDDPTLRLRMGRAARESVERNYSVAAWGPSFVAAIAGVAPVSLSPTPHLGSIARPKTAGATG
jgi:glycosyltransferase involved in cell wall biosynthesis